MAMNYATPTHPEYNLYLRLIVVNQQYAWKKFNFVIHNSVKQPERYDPLLLV